MHRLTDWVTFMQRRQVDEVEGWLRVNDLIEYFPNFMKHGWDRLAVIAEMTEKDIEKCIQKPGHKVKFKRALNVLKVNQPIIPKHGMDTESDQDSVKTGNTECSNASVEEDFNKERKKTSQNKSKKARKKATAQKNQRKKHKFNTEHMLSSIQTNSIKSEDTHASIDSVHRSKSCSTGGSGSSTTQSQLDTDIKHANESVDAIIMDIPHNPEGSIDVEDNDHGEIVPCVDVQNSDIDMEITGDIETISGGTDNSEIGNESNEALADINRLV